MDISNGVPAASDAEATVTASSEVNGQRKKSVSQLSLVSRVQRVPGIVVAAGRRVTAHSAWSEFLAEFVGTFMLIVVGNGAIARYVLGRLPPDYSAIGFGFGIGALIGVTASAHISGGHINPAVTVALAAINRFPWRKVGHYLLGQYLGGFAAAAAVFLINMDALNAYDGGIRSAYLNGTSATGGIFATYPTVWVSAGGVLADQAVTTACLMFAILAITSPKNGNGIPTGLRPIFIALTIWGIVVTFLLNCGAILNPARDLAPRLFTALVGYGWETFQPLGGNYWWLAGVVGPHLGAILGAWLYLLTVDHEGLSQLWSKPDQRSEDQTEGGAELSALKKEQQQLESVTIASRYQGKNNVQRLSVE